MEREKAIKRLEIWLKCANCPEDKLCYGSHLETLCEYYDYCEDYPIGEAIKVAIDALEELPKRRKEVKRWKGKWLHEKK